MRITEPFVLISQAPRSGGTMLMRLLDGHPQLWAIPHEWGTPFLTDFGGDPWSKLYDPKTERRARDGFRQSNRKLTGDFDNFAFDLKPSKMERVFYSQLPEGYDARSVYDAFLTGYFAAWKSYNDRFTKKRWVTGFAPRLLLTTAPFRAFNTIYPDGRVISLLRDPASWYASARVWSPAEWADVDKAADYWLRAASAVAKWKRTLGGQMLLIPFDRLVSDTEQQMREVADWLHIDFNDCLLEPTFNGQPIKANSSYPADTSGIVAESANRGDLLTDAERTRLAEITGAVYQELARYSSG